MSRMDGKKTHTHTTGRQTSLHHRPGALHTADMVRLQHFNRSIPFYMHLSDTGAFANKVAGIIVATMVCLEDGI